MGEREPLKPSEAAEALRQSEARFRALVENAPDIIARFDRAFRHLFVNRAIQRSTGQAPEDFIGKTNRELGMPEALTQYWESKLQEVFSSATPASFEFSFAGASFQSYAVPERGADGEVESVLVVSRDISDLRRAEAENARLLELERAARQQAEEAQERLAFLAEAGALLSASLDYETTLKSVARLAVPRLADLCAIDIVVDGQLARVAAQHADPARALKQQNYHQRFPPKEEAEVGTRKVLRTGEPELYARMDAAVLDKLARSPEHREFLEASGLVSCLIVPLKVHESTFGTLSLLTDVSGRHYGLEDLALAAELARRAALAVENARLYREAQDVNRVLEKRVMERTEEFRAANRELEGFVYAVSHDLRSPLSKLEGFSSALEEDYGGELSEGARWYLARLKANVTRMNSLIDGLLVLSRISRQALQRNRVNLHDLSQEIIAALQGQEPDRKLSFSCQGELTVIGDERLLRLALENLLDNAWKFSKESALTHIKLSGKRQGNRVLVTVSDKGAGFDPQYAHHLFEPFQRLHAESEFGGSGIGLVTVRRIVERHGGKVWAEGSPGEGASFSFSLEAPSS